MGGAAAVLSDRRWRWAALGGLLAGLIGYGAGGEGLPGLPSKDVDVVFLAAVLLPAFAAAIWLALPFVRARAALLFALAVAAGAAALALSLAGAGSASNVAKLSCYALLGFWFASLFEHTWWVGMCAVIVPWVDIWSVQTGPTRRIVEERPGVFEGVAILLDAPGGGVGIGVGPPDILFFACFLGAAARFRLRVAATWIAMTVFLGLTLVLVWVWQPEVGLPALPGICLGFLVANGDRLWDSFREHLRARSAP